VALEESHGRLKNILRVGVLIKIFLGAKGWFQIYNTGKYMEQLTEMLGVTATGIGASYISPEPEPRCFFLAPAPGRQTLIKRYYTKPQFFITKFVYSSLK
jgi:hypothetical protein